MTKLYEMQKVICGEATFYAKLEFARDVTIKNLAFFDVAGRLDSGRFNLFIGCYGVFGSLGLDCGSCDELPFGVIISPGNNWCIKLVTKSELVSCVLS